MGLAQEHTLKDASVLPISERTRQSSVEATRERWLLEVMAKGIHNGGFH